MAFLGVFKTKNKNKDRGRKCSYPSRRSAPYKDTLGPHDREFASNIDKLEQESPALEQVNKYEIIRELTVAKAAFGLNDRAIGVLAALVSYHQGKELKEDGRLIVFPSNKSLCERAHGMAESTLRRNLALLVNAGLILRHDSANGKRYSKHDEEGNVDLAFGFDLRPLLIESQRICFAAREVRAAEERLKRQRTEITVKLRDVRKYLDYQLLEEDVRTLPCPALDDATAGAVERLVESAQRLLRRKMNAETLDAASALVHKALELVQGDQKNGQITEKMDGSAAQNEQHIQNSNKEPQELEPALEKAKGRGSDNEIPSAHVDGLRNDEFTSLYPDIDTGDQNEDRTDNNGPAPCPIPLPLIVKACPKSEIFSQRDIRNWYDLISAAEILRPQLGISPNAWDEAQEAMGPQNAAVCVLAMLERAEQINNPGGYLRALTAKALIGKFSTGPMIMALMSTKGRA